MLLEQGPRRKREPREPSALDALVSSSRRAEPRLPGPDRTERFKRMLERAKFSHEHSNLVPMAAPDIRLPSLDVLNVGERAFEPDRDHPPMAPFERILRLLMENQPYGMEQLPPPTLL